MKLLFALGCVLLFACTAPTRPATTETPTKERQSYSIYGPNIGNSTPTTGSIIKDTGKTEFDEEEEEEVEEEEEEQTDPNSCVGVLEQYVEPACNTCAEGSCCAETAACANNTTCWNDCLLNFDETKCTGAGATAYQALGTCLQDGCAAECFPEEEEEFPPLSCDAPAVAPSTGSCFTTDATNNLCNPVTNAGCANDGSVCDATQTGFDCYPPPNEITLCQACGETEGFCGPGMACVGGQCARFCCDDGDCGTGTCDKTLTGIEVGLCIAPAP